jgi:hypothetical protein
MAGRRFWRLAALVGLLASAGCCRWCERNCGCCAPAGYAPAPAPNACCAPCQPAGYAPATGWSNPGTPCPTGCTAR